MKLYLCCIEWPDGGIDGFAIDENGKFVFVEAGDSKEEIKSRFIKKPLPDIWDYEKEWVDLDKRKVSHDGLKKALKKSEDDPESFSYLFKY
jgi:hypothetical protein